MIPRKECASIFLRCPYVNAPCHYIALGWDISIEDQLSHFNVTHCVLSMELEGEGAVDDSCV